MIFDTDILIWVQRGNEKAAKLIEKDEDRHLSIQSYMELLQGAKNKTHHKYVKNFMPPQKNSWVVSGTGNAPSA
ncbi:MAG: hypothetical protein JMN24_12680 [gamma proteobacterium endosymbiont of Lamellibrachia anaximandri]|nr:hypothetical protein [gamma proteobacterium endosymbiont of Lamellibrachia anaximandri]